MTGELQRVLTELWAKAESTASAECAFLSDALSPAINSALSAEGSESAEQRLAYAETIPLPHSGEPLSTSLTAQPVLRALRHGMTDQTKPTSGKAQDERLKGNKQQPFSP